MSDSQQSSQQNAQSVSVLVNTETRERWQVSKDAPIKVGRAEDNQLSLKDDVYASGHHAEIYFEDGVCYVKDLNSRNGTYKNNEPVTGSTPVQLGDVITFGRTKFELQ